MLSDIVFNQHVRLDKEDLNLRWNEHHISDYFGTLMTQL